MKGRLDSLDFVETEVSEPHRDVLTTPELVELTGIVKAL